MRSKIIALTKNQRRIPKLQARHGYFYKKIMGEGLAETDIIEKINADTELGRIWARQEGIEI